MTFFDPMPVIFKRLLKPILQGQEGSKRVRTDQGDMATAVDS
jgi:hypothetical protein